MMVMTRRRSELLRLLIAVVMVAFNGHTSTLDCKLGAGVALTHALPVESPALSFDSGTQDDTAVSASRDASVQQTPGAWHAPNDMHKSHSESPAAAPASLLQRFLHRARALLRQAVVGGEHSLTKVTAAMANGGSTAVDVTEDHETEDPQLQVEVLDADVVVLNPVPLADVDRGLWANRKLLHGCHKPGYVLTLPSVFSFWSPKRPIRASCHVILC